MLIHPIGSASVSGPDATTSIFLRSLLFTALLVVVGAGTFRHIILAAVRRRGRRPGLAIVDPAARRAADMAVVACIVLLAAVVGRFIVTAGPWHWSWLLQLGATAVVLVAYHRVRRTGRGAAGAAVGTMVLATTPMLSGHAMASAPFTGLTVLAGTIHVLGASGWLGTLAMIVLAGIPATQQLSAIDRDAAVAELVSAFSPTALVCASLVLVSGTFVAWVHLGSGTTLWRTDYAKLLFIKLAALATVAGIGAYNWRVVRPTLGQDTATRRLRYTATLELTMAIVVIVLTAVLVGVPLPTPAA